MFAPTHPPPTTTTRACDCIAQSLFRNALKKLLTVALKPVEWIQSQAHSDVCGRSLHLALSWRIPSVAAWSANGGTQAWGRLAHFIAEWRLSMCCAARTRRTSNGGYGPKPPRHHVTLPRLFLSTRTSARGRSRFWAIRRKPCCADVRPGCAPRLNSFVIPPQAGVWFDPPGSSGFAENYRRERRIRASRKPPQNPLRLAADHRAPTVKKR